MPHLVVLGARFSSVAAYMDGYDWALRGGALVGFREWLLTGTERWTNMPWWALVRYRANPTADVLSPPDDKEDRELLISLTADFDGFLADLEAGGLPKIFGDYQVWVAEHGGDPYGRHNDT